MKSNQPEQACQGTCNLAKILGGCVTEADVCQVDFGGGGVTSVVRVECLGKSTGDDKKAPLDSRDVLLRGQCQTKGEGSSSRKFHGRQIVMFSR